MKPLANRPAPAPLMVLTYEPGQRCPSCWHKAWHVGRVVAECGRCATALPVVGEGR